MDAVRRATRPPHPRKLFQHHQQITLFSLRDVCVFDPSSSGVLRFLFKVQREIMAETRLDGIARKPVILGQNRFWENAVDEIPDFETPAGRDIIEETQVGNVRLFVTGHQDKAAFGQLLNLENVIPRTERACGHDGALFVVV